MMDKNENDFISIHELKCKWYIDQVYLDVLLILAELLTIDV
jgi:hypothetical protein